MGQPGSPYYHYAYGVPPQPTPGPNEAFSWSWKVFSADARPWLTLGGTYFGLLFVPFIAVYVTMVGWSFTKTSTISRSSGDVTMTTERPPLGLLIAFVGVGVLLAVGSMVLQAGLSGLALGATAGEAPTLTRLFRAPGTGAYIGTALVTGLVCVVGFLLCIVPGIAAMVLFVFAPMIAMHEGVGPIEAMQRSYALVRANLGQTVLYGLLSWLVMYAGQLACYVGMIVSMPVSALIMAYAYRTLSGRAVVYPALAGAPGAPPAGPWMPRPPGMPPQPLR